MTLWIEMTSVSSSLLAGPYGPLGLGLTTERKAAA